MKYVINREDLEASSARSYVFEGYRYGATSVSFTSLTWNQGKGRLCTAIRMRKCFWSMKAKPPIQWARPRWR